jgi:hypothetical protein
LRRTIKHKSPKISRMIFFARFRPKSYTRLAMIGAIRNFLIWLLKIKPYKIKRTKRMLKYKRK